MKHLIFKFILFGTSATSLAQSSGPRFCSDPVTHYRKIEFLVCNDSLSKDYSLGICWSTQPSPSLFDNFRFLENQTQQEFVLRELKPNTDYYFRLFKLFTDGTASYAEERRFHTLPELIPGMYFQGGIIGYIYKPGDSLYVADEQHGLIVSADNLGYAYWGMHGRKIEKGTKIRIGHGSENTRNIMEQYGSHNTSFDYTASHQLKIIYPCAAALCAQYKKEGWEDWFLPSKQEWDAIFSNIDSLQMLDLISGESFWSSSEVFIQWGGEKKKKTSKSHFIRAWQVRFNSRILLTSSMSKKNTVARVKAMRYF